MSVGPPELPTWSTREFSGKQVKNLISDPWLSFYRGFYQDFRDCPIICRTLDFQSSFLNFDFFLDIFTKKCFLTDFLLFSERTREYFTFPAPEVKRTSASARTLVRNTKKTELCEPSSTINTLDLRGLCVTLGAR